MKIANIQISKSILITIAVSVAVSAILRSPNLFVIFISVWLLYKFLYPKINKWIFDSKLFASVLVFFCYIILLQCAVIISWLINHNFPLSLSPSLALIIVLALLGYDRLISKNKTSGIIEDDQTKIFNLQDMISLVIVAVISGLILVSPLVLNRGGDTKATLAIYLINGNVDDSAHLALVNDHIQFDRGVFLDSDTTGKTRTSSFYPAGWHSISAILIKTIYPNIKTGIATLWAYGIQKLFWFFVLFYLFFKVTFSLYKFITDEEKLSTNTYFWIIASTTILGSIFLLPIARDGFYSFLPQLIAALLSVPIILQICTDNNSKHKHIGMSAFLLMMFGGCLSWILPLPAFALAALIVILGLVVTNKFKTTLSNLFVILKENFAILFIIILSVITQIYVMMSDKSESAVSFIKGVTLDGGITQYNDKFLLLVCAGFILSIVLASNKAKKNAKFIFALILSLLAYCLFIYLIQLAVIARNAYYYYKLLDILLVITIPFCIVGIGIAINKICKIGQQIPEKTFATIILIGTILYVGLQISTLAYIGGYRDFPNNVSRSLYEELETVMTEQNYNKKQQAFYFKPKPDFDSYVQNEVANMIAKSNTKDNVCFNTIRLAIWKNPPINSLLTDIVKYCDGYHVDLVTDQLSYPIFVQGVADMGLQQMVTIKTY